jgi:hypothetical protein
MVDYEQQMRDAVKAIAKYGEEWAQFKPLANNLDELKKTVLSEEMLRCDPKLSLGEKEARARISEPYRLHLSGLREAEHKSFVAYAKLEAAKAKFEALRSLCSLEKMHMKTFEREEN